MRNGEACSPVLLCLIAPPLCSCKNGFGRAPLAEGQAMGRHRNHRKRFRLQQQAAAALLGVPVAGLLGTTRDE